METKAPDPSFKGMILGLGIRSQAYSVVGAGGTRDCDPGLPLELANRKPGSWLLPGLGLLIRVLVLSAGEGTQDSGVLLRSEVSINWRSLQS